MVKRFSQNKREVILVLVFAALSVGLYMLPTGFEDRIGSRSVNCRGKVLEVDNSSVRQLGVVKSGDQGLKIEILDGPFAGSIVHGNNPLLGQMSRDKLFADGDAVFVVLSLNERGEITFVNPQEYYRIGLTLVLMGLFALALLLFGGMTGAKAMLSFVFTGLMLWKVLVPALLKGYDPVLLSLGLVTALTGVISFLVAGISRKGVTAFLGAFLGVLTSCLMAIYFTDRLHIHGAVMPFAETLLYSGFAHLSLTKIYIAAVFIAASGALMDLAMDVAASMDELVSRQPDLPRIELVRSGFRVGRAVVGTMITTLLLAYSAGYVTLLMAFMAQGVTVTGMFNIIYVASEVVKTIVGSFGLVMVAPFTALVGGFVLSYKSGREKVPTER